MIKMSYFSVLTCDALAPVDGGTIKYSLPFQRTGYPEGTTASLECNEGYSGGSESITCQSDRTWSGNLTSVTYWKMFSCLCIPYSQYTSVCSVYTLVHVMPHPFIMLCWTCAKDIHEDYKFLSGQIFLRFLLLCIITSTKFWYFKNVANID